MCFNEDMSVGSIGVNQQPQNISGISSRNMSERNWGDVRLGENFLSPYVPTESGSIPQIPLAARNCKKPSEAQRKTLL